MYFKLTFSSSHSILFSELVEKIQIFISINIMIEKMFLFIKNCKTNNPHVKFHKITRFIQNLYKFKHQKLVYQFVNRQKYLITQINEKRSKVSQNVQHPQPFLQCDVTFVLIQHTEFY